MTTTNVWRTVNIGRRLMSPDGCASVVEGAGMALSFRASQMLERALFSGDEREMVLAKASAMTLVGDRAASTDEIFAAIKARGGLPCPPQAGPALRAVWRGVESLRVCVDPIAVKGDRGQMREYIWLLEAKEGVLRLDGITASPQSLWTPQSVWVYQVP